MEAKRWGHLLIYENCVIKFLIMIIMSSSCLQEYNELCGWVPYINNLLVMVVLSCVLIFGFGCHQFSSFHYIFHIIVFIIPQFIFTHKPPRIGNVHIWKDKNIRTCFLWQINRTYYHAPGKKKGHPYSMCKYWNSFYFKKYVCCNGAVPKESQSTRVNTKFTNVIFVFSFHWFCRAISYAF